MDLHQLFDNRVRSISQEQAAWQDKTPARLGDYAGNVNVDTTSSMVYVRLPNGQVEQALNVAVPNTWDWPVIVARNSIQPKLWQVISSQNVYTDFTTVLNGFIKYHVAQHQFMGPDMGMWDKRQVIQLSCIVKDAAAFTVQFYGAVAPTANGLVLIPDAVVDLSSYRPAAGALYVTLEVDDSGALTVHAGDNFGTLAAASVSYYPQPSPGQSALYVILLYSGQTSLSNNDIKPILSINAFSESTINYNFLLMGG
jgi:hypothetical protein